MKPRAAPASKLTPSQPTPTSTDPVFLTGSFAFDIRGPIAVDGPTMGYLGVYKIDPDAMMTIKFKGTVLLPSLGRWEIGIVQNLLNCREAQNYSQGGQFSFQTSFLQTLDVLNGATDIWLDTLGSGVATFDIKKPNTRVSIDLSAGDVPRSPQFPATRKRCKGTITEVIVSTERMNEFSAALIARNNGVLFPLVSTDDPYGYSYVLDVPSGGGPPDMSWLTFKPKFSKKITRPPFTVVTKTHPTSNEFVNKAAKGSEFFYEMDCKKSAAK